MYFFLKTIISAIIIVAVSEIAKKYTWTAAIIVSLPLTSLLAFVWLYWIHQYKALDPLMFF